MPDNRLGRRTFLAAGAAIGATAASGTLDPAEARTYHGQVPWAPHQADVPEPVRAAIYVFFTADEAAFIEAAAERLIPKDELGPGAHEAGVALFIDRQLAGPYGRGARWYMQGPWAGRCRPRATRSRLTPAELYRAAIKAIDAARGQRSRRQGVRRASRPPSRTSCCGELEKGKRRPRPASTPRPSSSSCCRTPWKASSPIRSMAATRTWRLEDDRLSRRALRLLATMSASTASPTRCRPVGIRGRPTWTPKS